MAGCGNGPVLDDLKIVFHGLNTIFGYRVTQIADLGLKELAFAGLKTKTGAFVCFKDAIEGDEVGGHIRGVDDNIIQVG